MSGRIAWLSGWRGLQAPACLLPFTGALAAECGRHLPEATMKKLAVWLAAPAMLVLAACGGDDTAQLDESLKNDLSLAAQTQQFPGQQFMSPYEMGYGPQGYPAQYPQQYPQPYPQQGYYYPQPQPQYGYPQPVPVVQRAPAPVVQRAPARAPSRPAPEPIRNTKRDAVLGAAAGAVLGAATSRDKLKGAVIGAAAGGVLGAIVGHTIDVKNP